MAIPLQNKPNVIAPGGDYPFGRLKDNPGNGTGTPINELVYGDFHQFFAKMMAEAGIAYNGLRDNAADGFQYFLALLEVIKKTVIDDYFEPWQSAVLLNGWTSPPDNGVFFRKDLNGRVYLKGNLQSLTASDTTAFVLPVGYRPIPIESAFPTMNEDALISANGQGIRITNTGIVIAPNSTNHDLTGIFFFTN